MEELAAFVIIAVAITYVVIRIVAFAVATRSSNEKNNQDDQD